MNKFLFCMMMSALQAIAAPPSLVNFKHLRHLTEETGLNGKTIDIVHVYANYPSYEWVGAKESGMEGIACVDDAARAAVVYLRHFELTRNDESRARAIALLTFVMQMETDRGMFYNFMLGDHSVNTTGQTSFESFGWWAARGVWSMSTGYRILKTSDPVFAGELKKSIELTFPHIDSLMLNYGREKKMSGYRVPGWLLYESGSDVSSELILGLCEFYAATRDPKVKEYITKLADGLIIMQDGDGKSYPYALHRSWQTMWHMWGNGQTQALATAGRLLKSKKMLMSAEREARAFYSRLLIEGFKKEIDVSDSSKSTRYDQIAYGVRPMAVGLVRLYEATQKKEYLAMAGLSASWLFGNNVIGQAMYDTSTGRCFDGIRDSVSLNRNSGAESTIEALYTLVELENYPSALKYCSYRGLHTAQRRGWLSGTFEDGAHEELTLAIDLHSGQLSVLQGKASKNFLTGPDAKQTK